MSPPQAGLIQKMEDCNRIQNVLINNSQLSSRSQRKSFISYAHVADAPHQRTESMICNRQSKHYKSEN